MSRRCFMARRFFYVSLGVLCLVAAYQIGAYQALAQDDEIPWVVRAYNVVVVDFQGNELVRLGPVGGLAGSLGGRGPGSVTTYDGEGNQLVSLWATTGGGGAVRIFDRKGNDLVSLGATEDGEGVIATYNRAGGVKAQWP